MPQQSSLCPSCHTSVVLSPLGDRQSPLQLMSPQEAASQRGQWKKMGAGRERSTQPGA